MRRTVDWLFRDRSTGAIVVAQPPNPPLWVFLATVGLRLVVPDDGVDRMLGWVGLGALAWWAADEVVRGVNPWRRLLGVAGLALVAVSAISRLT